MALNLVKPLFKVSLWISGFRHKIGENHKGRKFSIEIIDLVSSKWNITWGDNLKLSNIEQEFQYTSLYLILKSKIAVKP